MELQRILAKDSRTAMEQVHAKFGKDALVVSNKRARNKTELIVAIELEEGSAAALEEMQFQGDDSSVNLKEGSTSFDQVMESKVFKTIPGNDIDTKDSAAFLSNFVDDTQVQSDIGDEKREQLHAREIVDLVKHELAIMRREIKLSSQLEAWSNSQIVSESMRPLVSALNDSGMPLSLQAMVTDTINQSHTYDQALDNIAQVLGVNINSKDILDDMQGIHIICGNSGSGKTLMAARLAYQKILEYGENSVAIVSFKDSRFGAWSQLQLLGSQAGVDTFKADSETTLNNLLQELSSRKLIIIDTPGVGAETTLNTLTNLLPEANCHLVIAADSSEGGIKKYIDMNSNPWMSVMVSKLEENARPWPLINVMISNSVAVSLAVGSPSINEHATLIDGVSLVEKSLCGLPLSFV
jgi:flagellar biosynthesis protein FlhF